MLNIIFNIRSQDNLYHMADCAFGTLFDKYIWTQNHYKDHTNSICANTVPFSTAHGLLKHVLQATLTMDVL